MLNAQGRNLKQKIENPKRNSCDLESRNLFKRSLRASYARESRVTGASLLTLVFVFSSKAWPIFGATCLVVFVVDVVFVLH